jgi:ABC-type Na+ efflux pump permease subunit
MLKLGRALGVLIGALILLYVIDMALLSWWTSDPMIVQQEAVVPADTADSSAEVDPAAGDQAAAREELYQARAYEGLSTWAVATTGLAGLALLLWFALVYFRERRTFGPASQASAFPYWTLVIAAYAVGAVALFFYLIAPLELVRYINDLDFYVLTGAVGLLGALAIWVASIVGIGPVLRPSVPLGARFS